MKKKKCMDGGVLGFMEAASPLLNLVAPGLGTAVGLGTNLVASQASSPSPSTYTPLTPNTNKYGLQNGGPTPPPDSTYQRTLEMLSEFPITPSEALSRRVALSKYNDVVRSQEAIPEISGRLIPQGKINAYNTYAVKKSTPNFSAPEVARASTFVTIPTLVDKPKMEKGGPIKHRGWEYKQENNEIYTRKEGSADWTVPQGQAREAIIKRFYPDFGQATAPTAAPRTAPPAPLAPLGRVTPEVQANIDRTVTQLASKQSAGFGQGDPIPTVIGPEVPVVGQPIHPQYKFFQYDRPDTLEKIADFQRSHDLTPDAKWGRKTASAYTQQTSPDRLAVRKAYQDKVRQAAQDLAAQNNPQLRMYDEVYQSLMKTPQAKHINHCIGGVCTFLDRDVEPGIFKGAGQKDIFISNFEFDKKAQEMGWDRYDHKSNVEPEVGDILQYKYFTSRGRHAQLIIDTDPKKGYKTLDNGGKGPARFRWISKGDFEGRWKGNDKFSMELFRRNRINGQDVSPVTSRPGEFTPPTQDLSPFSIEATEDLGRKENKFIKGINSIVAKDEDAFRNIPQADLERLAILASAIPRTESEYGKGVTYKMESLARGPAKVYRRIKQGTPMSRTLSVGMSQINPQMLSNRIRDKYFKGMSDTKIERKLARDEKLSGQITLENLVDNYNLYRDDPTLYGGNDDYFWYALAKSHQSPMFFKDAKRKELLKSENVDYSNAVFAELNKFRTKPEFKSGGKLSEKIGTLVNEGYPQKQAAAIAYDMKRKGKLVDGGALEAIGQDAVKVKADNPNMPDSVELDEVYVDHDEVIARLKDIGKYVFPANTVNPITGNTFAEDAERITKANAAAEKRPYDKEAQAAIQRNNETLKNFAKVNEVLKGIETGMKKLKKGGKMCAECGGKIGLAPGGPIEDLITQEDLTRTLTAQAYMPQALIPSPKIVPMFDNVAKGMDLPWGSPYERSRIAPFDPLPTTPLPTGMPGDKVYSQPSQLKTITPGSSLQGAVDENVAARNKEAMDMARGIRDKGVANGVAAQLGDNKLGLGEGLQLGELAAKALLMARGYDRVPLRQASSPITQASYDPTRALQQGTYAYNAAADQMRNTTSRSALVGNIQQLTANAARTSGSTMAQYDQMNRQARTQYEGQMAAREQQNIGYKLQNEQVRQQDEAQFYNNLDTLLTSVGNYGRAKVGQQTNQKAVELLLQAFPQIAKYINV